MQLSDATLREGEQTSGVTYSLDQKINAGKALGSLGLESINVGFPATGEKDQRAIRSLATELDTDILATARAIPSDIAAALEAEADIIGTFAMLSDLQLEYVLHSTREQILDDMRSAVDQARDGGAEVQLGLADAFRTDIEHIITLFEAFPDVECVSLADSVGCRTPEFVRDFLQELESRGVNLGRVGVHFHNDLGLGTANALAANRLGIDSASVTVASTGERAGNTSLEELVVAGYIGNNDDFGINISQLIPTCKEVCEILDESVTPRKPVLGEEVFRHESGLHTAAMIDEPSVFEPFPPATFGGQRELVFGPKSGQSAARRLLERAGHDPTDDRITELLSKLGKKGPMDLEEATALAADIGAK